MFDLKFSRERKPGIVKLQVKLRSDLAEPSTGHRSVLSGEKAQPWSALGENPGLMKEERRKTPVPSF